MIENFTKKFILTCLVAGSMNLGAEEAKSASKENVKTKEAATTVPTAVEDKVIVTGQIIPENGHELVGTNVRVSGEEIRKHGYADINQVLRKVPGVYVREEDGYGLFPNISMRGVDPTRNNKISVMEDGILTAPAPYSAPSAYYTPNAARMSDIEVIKGGSQIKFGPSNTAGVLNYVSTPVPTEETFFFKQIFGSDNERRTHMYYGDSLDLEGGTLSYLLEGFYRENDGFKNVQGVDTNTGINEQVEPMLKLKWEPDTAQYQYFEFKIGYSDLEANETYLGLNDQDFKNDPYDRYWGSQWDQINSQQTRTYLKHYIELNNDTSLKTTAYYNKFHRNWHKLHDVNVGGTNTSLSAAMNDPAGLDLLKGNGAAGDTLRVRNNNRDYYSYGLQNELIHTFETGEIDHELTLGTRWHVDRIQRYQWNETYDNTGSLTGVSAKGSAGDRYQKTYAASIYVQDRAQLTEKLSVTAGVRSEYINYHHSREDTTSTGDKLRGTAQHSPWTGGVGFTYELTDTVDLFGGVHRGMTAPSPRGNIASNVGFERSNAYELGARYTNESKAFTLESTLFRTDFNNLIVPENIATGNDSDENAGEVRSQGLELSVEWDAGIANNKEYSNPWFLSATYTDAEFKNTATSTDSESIFFGAEPGNELPYIPKYQATLGTGLVYGKIGTFISTTYRKSTWSTGANTEDPTNSRIGKIDGSLVTDLSAYYQHDENLRFTFNVQNLLEEEYVASRHPHGSRPGAPRTVLVGLEYSF